MKTSHKLLIGLIGALFLIATIAIISARYFLTITVH